MLQPEHAQPTRLLTPRGRRILGRVVIALAIIAALYLVVTLLLLSGGPSVGK